MVINAVDWAELVLNPENPFNLTWMCMVCHYNQLSKQPSFPGVDCSSTPPRPFSFLSISTAWSVCPPPFLRSTNKSEMKMASSTWFTPPRRPLVAKQATRPLREGWQRGGKTATGNRLTQTYPFFLSPSSLLLPCWYESK